MADRTMHSEKLAKIFKFPSMHMASTSATTESVIPFEISSAILGIDWQWTFYPFPVGIIHSPKYMLFLEWYVPRQTCLNLL